VPISTPARSEPERFSVSSGSLARRLQTWSELASATLVPFEMRPRAGGEDFRGVLRRWRFGELALVDCAAMPCIGRRDDSLVDEREPLLGVQLMRRGVEVSRRNGREARLEPGCVVLWDSRRAVEVEVLEPMCKRTLVLPGALLFSTCPRLAEQPLLPPLHSSPAGRLLVRYLDALAEELPRLDAAGRAAAASAALELLRAAIEPLLPDAREALRAAMREDIRRYVRKHLQDPELGPASIARAYSISVRALHALFEDVDESVAGLVRRERLARCLEDLKQPGSGSVTSIAFRWGFCDAAHFSRAFKRAFGVTPRAVRQAALERAAAAG